MDIRILQNCVKSDKYEISLHAQRERYQENITIEEIENAILDGEIIEKYQDDPRGQSCLLLGYSRHRPIHIVCGILPMGWIRIITVYIPKVPKWITPKQRKRGG